MTDNTGRIHLTEVLEHRQSRLNRNYKFPKKNQSQAMIHFVWQTPPRAGQRTHTHTHQITCVHRASNWKKVHYATVHGWWNGYKMYIIILCSGWHMVSASSASPGAPREAIGRDCSRYECELQDLPISIMSLITKLQYGMLMIPYEVPSPQCTFIQTANRGFY